MKLLAFLGLPLGGGQGNPECWSDGFTYDFCCDSMKGPRGSVECWDESFTFEHCCDGVTSSAQLEGQSESRHHGNHNLTLTSGMIQERKDAMEKGVITISPCQKSWGWELNIQWGIPTGAYAESSGVPLRHQGRGWDSQPHGDIKGCLDHFGRFFLVQLGFEATQANDETTSHDLHFGFCAPSTCSAREVAEDLAPKYALQIADTRRVMMKITHSDAWEWPYFLDLAYVETGVTLGDKMTEVSFQLQLCLTALVSMLLFATLCDQVLFNSDPKISQPGGLIPHVVLSFSLKRSWQELWRVPKGGFAVDLLRGLATLFLLSLHLELVQIASRTEKTVSWNLRVSFYFRAVVAMTLLTLHLALGDVKAQKATSFSEMSQKCAVKLVRKFLRQFPLILASVWWDFTGSCFAFLARPLSYLNGTQSRLGEGSILQWSNEQAIFGCKASFLTCAFKFYTINWQVRDATERILVCFGFLLLQSAGLNYAGALEILLFLFGLTFFYIESYHEEWRWELKQWNYMVFKRMDNPGLLGIVLMMRRMLRCLPKKFITWQSGLLAAALGWLWSTWINRDDYALWCEDSCWERGVS